MLISGGGLPVSVAKNEGLRYNYSASGIKKTAPGWRQLIGILK